MEIIYLLLSVFTKLVKQKSSKLEKTDIPDINNALGLDTGAQRMGEIAIV
jgi:hypothetical protein